MTSLVLSRWENINLPWGPLDSDGEDDDSGGDDGEFSDIEKVPGDVRLRLSRTTRQVYMLSLV